MRKYLAKTVEGKATKNTSTRGNALAEILIATALTGVVVAAAGYGVSSMIGSSNAASARSDRRAELNRSLDFMSSEIRESTSIAKDVEDTTLNPTPSDFTASGTSPVKVLMIKTAATGSTPIIYYTATPTAGKWKGPRVVYRWGPAFNASGNYTNAGTPNTWSHEVLIDNIAAASDSTTRIGTGTGTGTARVCTNTTANPNNGGTYNGDSGFNACVDAAGRTAVIRQDGQIAKIGTAENYIASTNTGSRRLIAAGPTPSSLPSGATTASLGSAFTKDDPTGVVTVNDAKTITVTTLPGDGYPWDTSVRVAKGTSVSNFTNSYFASNGTLMSIPKNSTSSQSMTVNVTPGEMISIAGCSNGTGNMTGGFNTSNINYCPVSTANQGNTVFTFKQGDAVPNIAGAYSNGVQQPSLREIITGSKTIANVPAYSASTGKGLKSNELYYVYEIYTTDTSSTYRDLQDIVVKVTFN